MLTKNIGLFLAPGLHGDAMRKGVALFAQNRPNWHIDLRDNGDIHDALRTFRGDGLITIVTRPEIEKLTRKCGCPVVSVVSSYRAEGIPYVSRDLEAAGRHVGVHFQAQGLVHAAYFASAAHHTKRICQAEHRGLSEVMSPNEPLPYFDRGPRTPLGKPWAVDNQIADLMDWLHTLPKPIGVFCVDDLHGMRLLKAAQRAGYVVPDDVAVVGNHNDPSYRPLCSPSLSSVELGLPRQGYIAAEMLSEMMAGRTPDHANTLLEPVAVMARESSVRIHFDDPYVQSTIDYIKNNLMEDLSLDALAKRMHCSRRTLHRRFVSTLGKTPSEVITHTRIDTALHLLTETTFSITQITDRTGFGYASNLCRAIRKSTGCSPSEYRRRMSKATP